MTYYVNKVVGALTNPLMVELVSLAVVFVLMQRRNVPEWGRKALRWTFAMLLAGFWFWSTAIATRMLGLPLEREWLAEGRIPTVESYPSADAILCLGGSMAMMTNSCVHAEMHLAADRVWQTARLYKAGKAPLIFCTGGGCELSTKPLLLDFGVPAEAMTFLEDARNTEEEAREIVRTLDSSKNPTILLVTSAWHMRRAKMMFEKYAKGVTVIPAPADFEATTRFDEGFELKELLPSADAMSFNEYFLKEWIGYLGYKLLRR